MEFPDSTRPVGPWGASTAVACFVVAQLVVPTPATAQSPGSVDQGDHAGAVDTSPRVVDSNPAGLAMVDGVAMRLDHTLQLRSQSFESGGERADMFRYQSDPSVAFASDLATERFRVGFVGSLPRRYGSAWPSDGPQRYDSIFHRVRDFHFTAAGAFSPVDWLHVGASASFVQAEYRSYRAADMARFVAREEGLDPDEMPQKEAGNEGREFLDFSGRTFGWSAGVTATPGNFRVGASYHGPIPLEMEGKYELYVPQNEFYRDRYGGDVGRDATLETRWPGRIEAGVAYELDADAELFARVDWAHWSTVDERVLEVDESDSNRDFGRRVALDLNDTVDVRVGGEYALRPWLKLDASLGAGTASTPSGELTARVVELPKAQASVGARLRLASGAYLRTGYQHVQYLPTRAEPTDRQGGTAGTYRQTLGLVESSLSFRFH